MLLMSTQTALDYARAWLEEQIGIGDGQIAATPAPE
jgi:hypothetical protein